MPAHKGPTQGIEILFHVSSECLSNIHFLTAHDIETGGKIYGSLSGSHIGSNENTAEVVNELRFWSQLMSFFLCVMKLLLFHLYRDNIDNPAPEDSLLT